MVIFIILSQKWRVQFEVVFILCFCQFQIFCIQTKFKSNRWLFLCCNRVLYGARPLIKEVYKFYGTMQNGDCFEII